jgi:TrmH RNA methyltransferase
MYNKLTAELAVCGFNAVAALAEFHPEKINRLFLREDRFYSFTRICKQLAERKRPYKICEDEELERICKSNHHQGTVAMIEEPVLEPLSREDLDMWAREGKTGLVLHSVGNDHNLGAMIRSAAFFDCHFIVLSEGDTEARLTTSAYRVAEGGMEHVTVRRIRNTGAFLRDASQYIITIGADSRARGRVKDLPGIFSGSALKKKGHGNGGLRPGAAIVLGNEETGLPQSVKEACSVLLRIPGTGAVESLNVAQAATLFLYALFE